MFSSFTFIYLLFVFQKNCRDLLSLVSSNFSTSVPHFFLLPSSLVVQFSKTIACRVCDFYIISHLKHFVNTFSKTFFKLFLKVPRSQPPGRQPIHYIILIYVMSRGFFCFFAFCMNRLCIQIQPVLFVHIAHFSFGL